MVRETRVSDELDPADIPRPVDPESQKEIRKQISMFVPLSHWKAIRFEAARRKIPVTELCRRWMNPALQVLLIKTETGNED